MQTTAYHMAHSVAESVMQQQTRPLISGIQKLNEHVIRALDSPDQEVPTTVSTLSSESTLEASSVVSLINTVKSMEAEIKDLKTQCANVIPITHNKQKTKHVKDPNVNYSIPFWERPGSTHKYCWSCGPNKTHDSSQCRSQKPGHQKEATWKNWMGGNTGGILRKFL